MRQAIKTRQMAKIQSKGCEYLIIAKKKGDGVVYDTYRKCFEPFDGKFHKRLMGTDSLYENAIYDVSVFVEADIKGKQI